MSKNHILFVVVLVAIAAPTLLRQLARPRPGGAPPEIEKGPVRHERLPNPLVERIRRLESVFAEVYQHTHAEWLDGFQRDAVPEREVALWEAMAVAYTRFNQGRSLTLDGKREAFGLLLMRSATDEKSALESAKPKYLTPAEAQQLLGLYSALPQPVQLESR